MRPATDSYHVRQKFKHTHRVILLIGAFLLLPMMAASQVSVEVNSTAAIKVTNHTGVSFEAVAGTGKNAHQRGLRSNANGNQPGFNGSESDPAWYLMDAFGNLFETVNAYQASDDDPPSEPVIIVGGYQAGGGDDDPPSEPVIIIGGYQAGGGDDDPPSEPVIIVGGYQAGGDDDPPSDPVIIVGGYQGVLEYLHEAHGAVIARDYNLGVDLIMLPGSSDPILDFFTIITTEKLDGYFLYEYFQMLEIPSVGIIDEGSDSNGLKAPKNPFDYPNDTYYKKDWGLKKTRFHKAAWHSAPVQHAARVGVIDSGVGIHETGHTGLDGAALFHQAVSPTSGYPASHGLSLLTMLSDAAHDGDGTAGLLGNWTDDGGCYEHPALMSQRPPEIHSYNVGDLGPVSYYVTRAIYQAIDQELDVINLSMKLPESPMVTEAIKAAQEAGIIVVAAAGNYDGQDDKPATYPANLEGVIAVGSAGKNKKVADHSAEEGVDILAPGEDVVVGTTANGWKYGTGTSYAAVYVTAAAAMMRALDPDITAEEVLAALQKKADKKNDEGVGFLDVFNSLNEILPDEYEVKAKDIPAPHTCDYDDDDDDWDDNAPNLSGSFNGDNLALHGTEGDGFGELPTETRILDNYPNPFNPSTTIRFELSEAQAVRLVVYNTLGQEVARLVDGALNAGQHQATFQAERLPSGIYFARLETAQQTTVRSMLLVK